MATASVTSQPQVVKLGGAYPAYYNYTDAEAITKGDLIRLTTSGTIKLAETASAGAVSGIALEAGTTGGDPIKVLMFAPDTIVKIQCIDTVAPEDLTKGVAYTLEDGTSVWGVTATTTNGVALVMGYASDEQPWDIARGGWDEDNTTNNNSVLVRFTAATLDAPAAA